MSCGDMYFSFEIAVYQTEHRREENPPVCGDRQDLTVLFCRLEVLFSFFLFSFKVLLGMTLPIFF